MSAYLFRRLLLIVPTLLGILLINFLIIQAAPGGPVERTIARMQGLDGSAAVGPAQLLRLRGAHHWWQAAQVGKQRIGIRNRVSRSARASARTDR